MRSVCTFLIALGALAPWVASFALPSSVPVPSSPADYLQRPTNNSSTSNSSVTLCQGITSHNLIAPCWDILNVTQYLEEWWNDHQKNCTDMVEGTSFVSCYQQLHGIEQRQCDDLGPTNCDYPDDFSKYSPQEAYVLYSIFAVWKWFSSISTAVESADVSAMGPVGKVIQTINPPKQKSPTYLLDIFQAFTAFTPLLTLEKVFTTSFQYLKTAAIPETLLRQSPGVMKQLAPTGTLDSQVMQLFDIYDGLSKIQQTYQKNLTTALKLIQTDFSTFSLFTAQGNFIAPQSSLSAQTENLTDSLMTYIVSQCLTDVNIFIALARDTNPYELATNGSLGYYQIDCANGYDKWGICDEWWYDPDTNAAFSLSDVSNPGKKQHDLMITLFENGWTTPERLFNGSRACADFQASTGGIGNNTPTFDTVTFVPRCISNMQVCVWDQACPDGDTGCEFTGEFGWGPKGECKPSKDYQIEGCGDSEGSFTDINVPTSYLGPLVYDANPDHNICRK